MTKYSDWIIWNGGECPEEPDTLVQAHLAGDTRADAEEYDPMTAGGFTWMRLGHTSDIIAYRKVFEPKVETFKGACRARYVIPHVLSDKDVRDERFGWYTVTVTDGCPSRVVWEVNE